ncbi:aminopeptidase P family protein [Mesorhizobium sp. B2-6-4]|uniref:M24 family metallopeptidase n=1 Tax=Mesorhizobium sp. B2-6-4 TaxID=2589913 RepID=UPI001127C029|nr:aminopeptidase P family protein [Mesorhizobium sp. B2-6-4]TPJ52410.1 aminopeptidase P family protein [Mesorhizobium sp. B2-6-4]
MLPAPPSPDVSLDELAMRLAAVRSEMAQDAVDFLVLTNQKNIEYFTDYRTLSWGYHSRPLFVVIDHRDILVIANRIESRNLESRPRAFSIVYYAGYLAEGARTIVQEISARDPAATTKAAIDYGQDMLGRGSLEIVDGLRARGGLLESATDLLWRTRVIKSPFEAGLKRISFEIVNAAFDDAVSQASLGITEVELCRQIQSRIILNGAECADPIAMTFCRGEFNYSRPPQMQPLAVGQYAWTDFRSTYGGYPADRNRIARGGPPERWEIDAYERTRGLTVALANGVRAGMTSGDVFAAFEQLWRDAGLPPAYGLVSRIGHGGGLDVTEPPSISKNNPEIIRPGMILHLEPKLEIDGAVFQFEEVIYVRDKEVEFLSELSPERMPVIN